MKRSPLAILILCFFCFSNDVCAQHPFDILEKAYTEFNSKKFKSSAKLFENYFKRYAGTPNDFYFAALSFAQSRDNAKALFYADKAATGVEVYDMMLADPGFKSIAREINVRKKALDIFYNEWSKSARGRRQRTAVIDSLYLAMPARKLSLYYFSEMLGFYAFTLKDSTKLKLVADDLLSATGNGGTAYRWKSAQQILQNVSRRASGPFKKILASKRSDNPRITEAEVAYFTEERKYNEVTPALLRLWYEEPERFSEVLIHEPLAHYYASQEGQRFLRFWIDLNVVPTISKAQTVFMSESKVYASNKKMHFDFWKADNFKGIATNGFDIYSGEARHYAVPRSFLDELPSNRWNIALRTSQGRIECKYQDKDDEDKKLLLLDPIGDSRFALLAGEYGEMSAENLEFVTSVREGKWSSSAIPGIQERHLRPLIKVRYFNKLNNLSEDGEEVGIFILEANVDWLFDSLLSPFTDNVSRVQRIKALKEFKIRTPAMVEELSRELAMADDYANLDENEKVNYRALIRAMVRAIPESLINHPDFNEIKVIPDQIMSVGTLQSYCAAKRALLDDAWSRFKNGDPFARPKFVNHEEHLSAPVDKSLNYFLALDSGIVYYDLFGKIIFDGSSKIKIDNVTNDTSTVQSVSYEEPLEPLIKGTVVGSKAYLSTASHHVDPFELAVLPLTKYEVDQLEALSIELGLKWVRSIKTQHGTETRYDRMYVFQAFQRPLVFYHGGQEIFCGYLDKTASFRKNAKVFFDSVSINCLQSQREIRRTEYVENLNSLKVASLPNGNLVTMASLSVTSKNWCEPSVWCRVVLKVLDPELNIISEKIIPMIGQEAIKFNSNADVALKVVEDRIFAFVLSSCCGEFPLYMLVLDQDLNVIQPLTDISADEEHNAMSLRQLAMVEYNHQLYVAYTASVQDENIIEIRKISLDGKISPPAHIEVVDYSRIVEMTKDTSGLNIYFLEELKTENVLHTLHVSFETLQKTFGD